MGGNKDWQLLTELASKPESPENDAAIVNALKTISVDTEENEPTMVDVLSLLLEKKNLEIQCQATLTIAELLKIESNRVVYAQENIIKSLITFIKKPVDVNHTHLIKQACRALGNMCCDCTAGRDAIVNTESVNEIVHLLSKLLRQNDDVNFANMRLCACKLFLNFFIGGADYIKLAVDSGFLKVIYDVLKFEFGSKDKVEDCLSTTLEILSVILDNAPSLVFEKDLNLLVVDILKDSKNIEVSEMCLEHLHAQAEHDEVKIMLAESGVPLLLWRLLEEHKALAVDEETRQLMKLACNLIVLILTGDDSMHLLYGGGEGEVYLNMVQWLDAEDLELVTTAILAVGNFARTDTHCVHMMETGVFAKLLEILSAHKSSDGDIRLQHAALSGLRNLVIPRQNKATAIDNGIMAVLLDMCPSVTQYQVVFKLLATLRMLVDGQEQVAEELVTSGVLSQVCLWGTRAEHAGAAGEAPRLLAWIVRQLHNYKSISKLIQVEGCIGCLVNMLVATHAIMQNEAITSLSILCVTSLPNEDSKNQQEATKEQSLHGVAEEQTSREVTLKRLVEEFIKADVGKQIVFLLETNISKMQPELIENLCKFFSIMTKCRPLKEHLVVSGVNASLEKVLSDSARFSDVVKSSLEKALGEMKIADD